MIEQNNWRLEEQSRLATELEVYAAHKNEWLQEHSGEYVVVKGSTVLGFYAAWEQALRAGVEAFGVREDFLVRQVLAREPVFFVFLSQPSCSLPRVRQRYQQATDR